MQIPTLKVKAADGDYMVINESDFIEGVHELFVEQPEPSPDVVDATKEPKAPKAPKA